MYAIVPSTRQFVAGEGPRQSTLWTGFRRFRRRRASGPVRPVTLRRHLSMALPLSESRRHQLIRSIQIFTFPFLLRRLHPTGRKSIGYVYFRDSHDARFLELNRRQSPPSSLFYWPSLTGRN